MLRRISKYIYLVCTLIFFASDQSFGQDISIASGEKWFNENQKEILLISGILLENPAINRVDPDIPIEFVSKYEEFDVDTELTYDRIKKKIIKLGIVNARVSRVGSNIDGELISIDFTLIRRGLSVSGGESLTIEYIPNKSFIIYLDTIDNIMKPLDLDGWYVVVHRDQIRQKT